jgi:signal transduction histidine kinase
LIALACPGTDNRVTLTRMSLQAMTRVLLGGVIWTSLACTGWSQTASSWRFFGVADGLAESACTSLSLTPQGKVLVRHGTSSSISELDGYGVNLLPSPDGARGALYESPAGQLWTVLPRGLAEYKEGRWLVHPVQAIADEVLAPNLRTPPLFPVRQDVVLVLLSDQLLQFGCEDPAHPKIETLRQAGATPLGRFSGLALARDGGLWVTGARGLAKVPGPVRSLTPNSQWQTYIPPESLQIQNLHDAVEAPNGSVTVLADSVAKDQRVVASFDGKSWSFNPLPSGALRQIWRGPDDSWWAYSDESLFHWENGLSGEPLMEDVFAHRFYDVAVDPAGSFWLGTSEGLFRYSPSLWRSPARNHLPSAPVQGLASDSQGGLWALQAGTLYCVRDEETRQWALPETSQREASAEHALFALKNGTILVRLGQELLLFRPGTGRFTRLAGIEGRAPTQSYAVLGQAGEGQVCLQTFNGEGPTEAYELELYDGNRVQPFPPGKPDSTLGAGLVAVFAARNGDYWLASDHGVGWFHDNKWRTFSSTDQTGPEGPQFFAELPDGKICCATHDRLWQSDGRNWAMIRRGFGNINAMVSARDGTLWLATSAGLHRFSEQAWLENSVEEGLPGPNIRELCEDKRGRLWAGTSHGLSVYHPEADLDPPKTVIRELTQTEKKVHEGDSLTLSYIGQDKWKYTSRARLLYSYRVDQGEWSSFREITSVSFSDLRPGKHYFQIRAMDRNANVEANPAQLEFAVLLPWYRESRLVIIGSAGLAAALFFAGLAVNRHLRLLRSYAEVEKQVVERTKQLDLANRELLQSQKMNALGTLAAGIAHDFNNILSIIKGSAQIIEENLQNPDKINTRVDRIKTVVEQGSGIVKAMLGFSRDSDLQNASCDVNNVVEDTTRLLGDRFLREVQISFEPIPGIPEVCASRDLVQQILLNFIFNAAESMSGRKQVVVTARTLEALPESLVLRPAGVPLPAGASPTGPEAQNSSSNGSPSGAAPASSSPSTYVAISVKDLGCGIPPENLSRIFEPFFTTKALSARRGTGLGLSMVYELAKKLRAGLAVESTVDQGSTFTLILPAVTAPAPTPVQTR